MLFDNDCGGYEDGFGRWKLVQDDIDDGRFAASAGRILLC